MKGVAIDHEDYFKARQFNRKTDDPQGVWEKARQRGREVFGGLFAEFPEAKVLGFWMFSDPEWEMDRHGLTMSRFLFEHADKCAKGPRSFPVFHTRNMRSIACLDNSCAGGNISLFMV
jgi:hypothetical protein